jgi:hypothetical protein
MLARLAVTLAAATISVPAVASEPVLLYAAGSLRTALTEVAGHSRLRPDNGCRRNTALPAR